jgi:hypothetical protein
MADSNTTADPGDIGTGFPPTSEGVTFPGDHVVAAIADSAEAQRAAEALQQAGTPTQDVTLLRPEQVLRQERSKEQSVLDRLLAVVRDLVSEEGLDAQVYMRHAQQGHTIVSVRTPDSQQVESVHDILAARQAQSIKHFGRWAITTLPS